MKKSLFTILLIIITASYFTPMSYAYSGEMLIFVTPQSVEFSLEDPMGNIAGYTTNGVLSQIPAMKYEKTAEISSEDEQPESEKFNSFQPTTIPNNYINGKYRIKLYGNTILTNTRMSIKLVWDTNVQPWSMEYRAFKLVYPNSVWTYEFDVPATPTNNGQIVLTKVSTPADLIKDLTTAGQLGYIGNPKFVSELTKEINEIEAEKAKGKIDDGLIPAQKAKKEYMELLKEITEKYNKPESDEFVKQEAYTVLKEDLEYIINHLQ